mmetsp:Transcript_54423/g.158132  ORF Transcript_54423/g.158132 Transcript_54423/m.158132 type:complete len:578 (+) Transcript_54423:115-1848(+)
MSPWDRRQRRPAGAGGQRKAEIKHQAEAQEDGEEEAEAEEDSAVASVVRRIRSAADALGLKGKVATFGSHLNGLSTASSDCDLSYMPCEGNPSETPVGILQRFANELPRHGFHSIITIYQASIPLVKAIDSSGTEVDLCVGNFLGHRNSKLVAAYCSLDPRVSQLGKLVKQWAKAFELVGPADGHLNSYAYTLMTIYYLMTLKPPVVPNLQDLASQGCEPVIVRDRRWGREIPWDCRFWEHTELIPRSVNTEVIPKLLQGFFKFYTSAFDWGKAAVSVRTALTALSEKQKFELHSTVQKDQWYVEDPFDLKHNLAAQCTKEGRQRILEKMNETLAVLDAAADDAELEREFAAHTARAPSRFPLKCRVHLEKVAASDFTQALKSARDVGPFTVWFPSPQASRTKEVIDAFAIFNCEADRRKVHRLNETYVGGWQLRLLPCSTWALEDAQRVCQDYEELEVLPPASVSEAPLEVLPAASVSEVEAAERDAAAEKASEEVRSGLRFAQSESEVKVFIQRAQAMGLEHEVDLGNHKLQQLLGSFATLPSALAASASGRDDSVPSESPEPRAYAAAAGADSA